MQPLALTPEQSAVGCILHQRVLEGIIGIGWCAVDEQQAGIRQPIECLVKLWFLQIANRRQQPVSELATDRRTDLRDILGGRPNRSNRAISEACNVAGTDNARCGSVDGVTASWARIPAPPWSVPR